MKWTTETPTRPGLYLHRYNAGDAGIDAARVYHDRPGGKLWVSFGSVTQSMYMCCRWWPSQQWAGPIPEPEDA